MTRARAEHWDRTYTGCSADDLSWYEDEPRTSLELINTLGVDPGDAVVDVGGGQSLLVDALVDHGFSDLTVLDVSAVALGISADRVGSAAHVEWVVADVVDWEPSRKYTLWHDRAVLHFLVDPEDRAQYLRTLTRAVGSGSVVLATFAPDGPDSCSGLPVVRYGPDDLATLLDGFDVVEARRVTHVTPWSTEQPFTYVAARSQAQPPAGARWT